MTDKPDRKQLLTAAGGAGVLAGTAALPRVERAVQGHRQSKADAKVAAARKLFEAHKPEIGPTGRRKYSSPAQKAAFASKGKKLVGDLNAAQHAAKGIKRPYLSGNAKATWTGIAIGAPAVIHGVRHQFSKAYKRHDADAGLAGAALGAGGYQEAGYALKPLDRRAERKISADPRLKAKQMAHQKAFARPKNAKAGDASWHPYFRNYPKDLPGGRLKRALAVSHTGKTGGALTTGAAVAGGVAAASVSRKIRERKVQKNTEILAKKFFGDPKGRVQQVSAFTPNGTERKPSTTTSHYKGKSLIRRRPKYQLVVMPDHIGGGDVVRASANYKTDKGFVSDIHRDRLKGKKTTNSHGVKVVHKAAPKPGMAGQLKPLNPGSAFKGGKPASPVQPKAQASVKPQGRLVATQAARTFGSAARRVSGGPEGKKMS